MRFCDSKLGWCMTTGHDMWRKNGVMVTSVGECESGVGIVERTACMGVARNIGLLPM